MKGFIAIGAALTALTATAFAQQAGHPASGAQHQQLAQAAGGAADQSLPSGFARHHPAFHDDETSAQAAHLRKENKYA